MNNLPPMSQEAERVLTRAADDAANMEHFYLGVEHLVIGLARDVPALVTKVVGSDRELEAFRTELEQRIFTVKHRSWGDVLIFTPRCLSVMQLAGHIAQKRGNHLVEPQHIMQAVLRERGSVPARLLESRGVEPMP